jgi:hypothetical protein
MTDALAEGVEETTDRRAKGRMDSKETNVRLRLGTMVTKKKAMEKA